jgi:hypothetical protein
MLSGFVRGGTTGRQMVTDRRLRTETGMCKNRCGGESVGQLASDQVVVGRGGSGEKWVLRTTAADCGLPSRTNAAADDTCCGVQ